MDFLKFLPVIFQLMNLIPRIQEALRNKTPVIDLLQKFAPELLPLIQQLAGGMFPGLSPPQAADAGALMLAPDVIREVQNGLIRLSITDDSNAALVADGSYGQRTKQAVMKFQKAHGLTADGWAGKVTQAAIASEVAKLPTP